MDIRLEQGFADVELMDSGADVGSIIFEYTSANTTFFLI